MSATSGGSVSEGSEAGGSSQSTMSVGDSPSTSFQANLGTENVTKITLSEEDIAGSFGGDMTGSKINLSLEDRPQKDGIVNVAFDYEEGATRSSLGSGIAGSGSGIGISGSGISGGGMGSSVASMGVSGGSAGIGISAGGTGMGIGGSGASMGIGGGGAGMGTNSSGAGLSISGGGASMGITGSGSGITGGGGSGGGDFRSINGSDKKDKVPEAVNLELVNMVPYSNGNGTSYGVPVNGIPMKKDSEQVDMSTPYDEYFVPVNEHKKYMRGEKLYVTKDKRRPTSWRRCLSWIVACTVISVVLILAILAGTGVILSQEPNLVKEASVGRNFAGSNLKPSVTNKSPTAEMYMYVPRSIESEFVIDNLDFDPAFKNVNSTAYQQFAANMEDQLKMLLFDKETLEFGASDIGLKVVNVSRDPFKVNYRIGWNYKQGVNNPPEPIKMEDVKKRLVESLAKNQGYIDKYHIDSEAIKVNHVINTCQMDNGGCSHICYYNYHSQQFVCTCPTHLVLDNSGKNCVAWTGSSEDDALPVPSHTAYPGMPYESTANPAQEEDFSSRYEHGLHHHHHGNQHDHSDHSSEHESRGHGHGEHTDHEATAEPAPEPTAEPSPGHKDSSSEHDDYGIHSSYDTDHEAAPEPTAEPNAKNKYDHPYHDHDHSGHDHSGHDHSSHDHSGHDHSDEDDSYHDMHSVYDTKEPAAEPEPAPEPTAEPNPKDKDHSGHFIHGYKEHESSTEPTPEPAPEPTGDENSEGRAHDHDDHSSYGFKDHESAAEPTPEPAPEPTAEPTSEGKDHSGHPAYGSEDGEHDGEPKPEPTAESKDHDYFGHSVHVSKDHESEPAAEPTPEPSAAGDSNVKEHEHSGHSHDHESKDHEPTAEPTPEPTATGDSNEKDHDHTDYKSKDHETAAEPTPEPTATQDSGEKDYEHSGHSVFVSKDHEPSAEPTPEPTAAEDSKEKDHDHAGHSVYESKEHEPSAEPTPEPTVAEDSKEKDSDHTGHSVYESKEREPSAEPTPEPTATGDSGEKNHDHSGHSDGSKEHSHSDHSDHYGSKDHEPAAEPTPEPTADSESSGKDHDSVDHIVHGSKDQEHVAEPTAEPTADGNNKDHAHAVITAKDQDAEPQPTPEPGSDYKEEAKLHSVHGLERHPELKMGTNNEPQPTREVSSESDTMSGTVEHTGTTIHPIHEHVNPGQTLLSQDLSQKTESGTEYPSGTHPTHRDGSVHHMPHLEDILIRKVSPSSENGTGHSQNPLDNVELENGKPVIEEVIIDKSERKSPDQTGFSSVIPVHMGSESDSSSGTTDSSNNRENATGGSDMSSTTGSGLVSEQNSAADTERSPKIGISTDHPKIVEYTTLHALHDSGETEKSDPGSTENPSFESTGKNKEQDPLRSIVHVGGDNQPDQEHKVNPTRDNMPATTLHPDMQQEHHTIPVSVQWPTEANSETKPKQEESRTDVPTATIGREDSGKTNSGVLTGSESPTIMETEHDGSGGQISGRDGTKSHETATEPQVAMTTLLTILTPEGVEKIKGQLAKDLDSKEKEVENKTVNIRQSQQEGNETTKSPEEISNNIKDELLENEEFNTLIDEEYKNKDDNSSEGKETISKYPNKSLKTEKKKIKDYVKGEKIDPEKKGDVTTKPGVTTEDFILQKHVNGNEHIYDLDFSLQNEHTTKHDGEVTVADPHSIDGVPGVVFKPHGISNHDIRVLQTVAPDFRTETIFPTGAQELETLKPDSKTKFSDSKEGEVKTEKDYPKLDKDYKYEKQKVSKKKDLKKKIGGKDGKNVELDDGRKYFTEISKEDLDVSSEEGKDSQEVTMNPFEKITVQPEVRTGFGGDVTAVPGYKVREDPETPNVEIGTKVHEHTIGVTELPGLKSTDGFKFSEQSTSGHQPNLSSTSVDEKGHLTIDEPTVKSTSDVSPGTVYDGQLPGMVNYNNAGMTQAILNSTSGEHRTPGTVFDGLHHATTGDNTTYVVYQTKDSVPKIVSDGKTETVVNSTTAHPTIIIHGQSGSLQDGHLMRFGNSTFFTSGNGTVVSIFNGTLTHPDGHSFSFTNYTATFPNGSAVHPTIVVRGQSGTLQDGHQSRFGNATHQSFGTTFTPIVFKNSNVYRIENDTGNPGTVFDGHFDPQNGHYHMFTNSSGTFVYTNTSTQPAFIIKGDSGDFGNSTAYIIRNNTRTTFSSGFVGPESVIFRNSTVFAVENDASGRGGVQEITVQPHELSNETITFTNQMSPSFVSSGTAYKVNDYFGYISKCAAGQFQCVNGTSKRGSSCISLSSKCDSIPDCSDGSDELGCIENGCPGNFQCSDGTCLKRNLVCNGILDCSDESDEKNCESWKCEFDEFQCPSGRCIPIVWQCDGKPDCDNHTDEYNCQNSCGNDEYLCPEGWCIPLTYKCNGIKECSNGEDEQLCDCSHEEFKCHTGGCVSMKNVCDGLDDCPDRSDEWDCVKLEPESNLLKIRSPSGEYAPVCADKWSSRYSDEVCASLGYFSSVPIENENASSITTDSSFYVLKNDTTADFNKKIIVNLRKGDGKCSSGKFVEISCQEFTCGSRSMTDSSSVEARLVGGMSAASGQWPSVALLYNVRNFHSCTANVLTPRWVLASYNCLKMGNKNLNEQDWKFFGGSTVFETEKENAETRKILRIIPHPQLKFNQFLFTNDLALVELDQSLQFTSNLGAVCLPQQEIQPRQICVTAGWGMNAPEDKAIKQQLQYLPVPTMNLTECNSTEHYSGFITDDKICAGYNSAQKSLCYNEEGAPLMCVNDGGEWELQGVLSYHSNCGRGSHPSIFSSITPVADWIKKTIGNSFERKALPAAKR